MICICPYHTFITVKIQLIKWIALKNTSFLTWNLTIPPKSFGRSSSSSKTKNNLIIPPRSYVHNDSSSFIRSAYILQLFLGARSQPSSELLVSYQLFRTVARHALVRKCQWKSANWSYTEVLRFAALVRTLLCNV